MGYIQIDVMLYKGLGASLNSDTHRGPGMNLLWILRDDCIRKKIYWALTTCQALSSVL